MRFVALDTETTGMTKKKNNEVSDGHKIIEIGCVEIIDGVITGKKFHSYLNPGRKIDEAAINIHGIKDGFLKDKPNFIDIVDDFLNFIDGATLIIHNAAFDISFLDKEFKLLPKNKRPRQKFFVIDTLHLTRQMYPHIKHTLDDLAVFYKIIPDKKEKHGALRDAQILAMVYLQMLKE